ncbi:uncharacterized protein K02A2.6-like [Anopheles arabiensis]|uniref:uncharacterized protein K02A2.6-like n=1 Tax=Anopheles arabiensis TaxID=7173 RepID=UPI001AAD7020|nr:uncharacterized protein K02A2.6-like [Anopheles arabiensis]
MNPADATMDLPTEEEQRRASLGRPGFFNPAVMQQPGASQPHVPSVHEVAFHHQVSPNGHLYPPSQLGPASAPPVSAPSQFVQPPSQTGSAVVDNAVLLQTLKMMQQHMTQQQQLISKIMSQQTNQPAFTPNFNPEQATEALANSIMEFRFDPEAGITFRTWFSRYEELFNEDACRLSDAAKVRLLLRKLGAAEHDRYLSFILPLRSSEFSFKETIAKLAVLFDVQESLISKRYKCLQLTRKPEEDLLTYACRVNKSCVEFELSKLDEEQLKCLLFVCGLREERDVEVRTRLLAKIEDREQITLQQLSEECSRIAALKRDSAMIQENERQVLALHNNNKKEKFNNHTKAKNSSFQHRQFPRRNNVQRYDKQRPPARNTHPSRPCWLCGDRHWVQYCGYKSHKCQDCGRIGHREGHCNTANQKGKFRQSPSVETRIVTVNACAVAVNRKYVNVLINGKNARLQLDTGSDITIINRSLWQSLGKPPLNACEIRAKTVSGASLHLDGEFEGIVTVGEKTKAATIRVACVNLLLLGADIIDAFDLGSLPMNAYCGTVSTATPIAKQLETKFPSVFRGSGLCTKARIKVQVKENTQPTFCPKRPVAYAMQEAVNKELDRLEQLGVITPVDYSEWAAPIVVVRKANGTIRICGDYSTGLNSALRTHEYPLPLPEDIFAKLAGCKYFSTIDLSDAFLQVEVEEKYRSFLVINTHRGLYTYNRLPPGIKIAPAAFQQIIDTMLAGLNGVCGYMDDVIVGGKTEVEHDANLYKLLQRIESYEFTIRAEKCSFKMYQIPYLGHIIDHQGIKPNPEKIAAILNLPAPTDLSGVRSFLGAINYYGKFVPNMRELRYPLDMLLKKDGRFEWTLDCEKAFKKFKEILSSNLLLTHYDPRAKIVVSADASSIGVGATISHVFSDGSVKVIQHASRALTKAETGYSQIDREGLAIVYAVTKFHKMLFGRHFILQTDHRPLLRIFGSKKGIPIYTANRLQRFALTLQLYDFEMEYIQSDKFGNADVLSRLIQNHAKPEPEYVIASASLEEDLEAVVINAISSFPLTFRDVEIKTQSDPVLRQVYTHIKKGWPTNVSYGSELARYHDRRESLSAVNNCILFGERVVIPKLLQKQCLSQIHHGHPGIQRMKALARSYMYWPSMDRDITEWVNSCHACQAAAKSPPSTDKTSWPKSSAPWQRLHIDYAGPLKGEWYLILVDSFSKWPEIVQTSNTSSAATIAILRSIFARFGMPMTLVSDNGTQFCSIEFERFCKKSGIIHVRTAPYHPQSNGQAERFVDTFKRAMRKIEVDGYTVRESLDIFLQTYRSTPNACLEGSKSPAEIMLSRRPRIPLDLLTPLQNPPQISPTVEEREFCPNQNVYAKHYSQNGWRWITGTVLKRQGRVMYVVRTADGKIIRRHIHQLRRRTQEESSTVVQPRLPLDVLLEAWNLDRVQSPPAPAPSPPADLPLPSSISDHQTVPVLPPATSTQTFGKTTTARPRRLYQVQEPRRSSRNRRLPSRFDVYRIF